MGSGAAPGVGRRDLPALRRQPGPVPEGWRRTPPSLLRYSDEQTVAATVAVFAAIAAMGPRPGSVRGLGGGGGVAIPGSGVPGGGLAELQGRGGLGHLAPPDPPLRAALAVGTISLALGLHGPNVGVGGGLHADGRRVPGGPDLAGSPASCRASGWSSAAGRRS